MLKQQIKQKQIQKLSPQNLQFIKLLQIPGALLDSRIKEEIEKNPALEDSSLTNFDLPKDDYSNPDDADTNVCSINTEELNSDQYLDNNHEEKDYSEKSDYDYDNDHDNRNKQIHVQGTSFWESLKKQLDFVNVNERQYKIAYQIIGSLDGDGYLRRSIPSICDDIAFTLYFEVSEEEILNTLRIIQSFDPPGVGARNLRECLILQLRRKNKNDPAVIRAVKILEKHLDDFSHKRFDKLQTVMHISSAELKESVDIILKLNPKPGDPYADVSAKSLYIIPDFIITNDQGTLNLSLNSKNTPELKVSKSFRNLLEDYDGKSKKDPRIKEAALFVKQKIDSAKWFIDAIKQRRQTLMKTMNAIMRYQYDYFLTGDEKKLRPMILKDIADMIDMDISTVSRVASSKYVQTDFGLFSLKFFFSSEALQTDSGEEVSGRKLKSILQGLIKNEDKHQPLSDDKLSEILHEKGYSIARRTVAKYREQLGMPVARLRRTV